MTPLLPTSPLLAPALAEVSSATAHTPWWLNQGLQTAGLVLAALGLAWLARQRYLRLRTRAMELEILLDLADRLTRELESANKRLHEETLTDPLTGLRNRRFLQSTIERDIAQVDRAHAPEEPQPPTNSDMVLLIVDLDDFKRVNDQFGHQAGDAVLVQTAHLLQNATRGSDTVVRWGGEEFLVVARHSARSEATTLAERIRGAVDRHAFLLPDRQTLHLTCSVGFACYPLLHPSHQGWEGAVAIADQCLYQAKAAGKNRWVGHIEPILGPGTLPLQGGPGVP